MNLLKKRRNKTFDTRTWIRFILLLLLAAALLFCVSCGKEPEGTETEKTDTAESVEPPHVHEVAEWNVTKEPTVLENGERQGVCTGCGEPVTESILCVTAHLPRVYLTGDMTGITKEYRVTVGIEYVSDDVSFSGYASMDIQGGSSAAEDWSKRNYNIRLFRDADLDKKLKIDLGFGKESKYCLKANFIDATHARNIVTARLWGEMIATREGVPEQLAAAPNGGAVDGFPVLLFHDGEWMGVYTLNIPKDEWMFNIHGSDTGATVFMTQWSDSGKFQALLGDDPDNWEVKYESDDLKGHTWGQLRELIRFVVESSDEEFEAHIDEYVDVNSVIDYMLLMCMSAAPDNTSKNIQYVTYDGKKFYMSPYDLDATWGLHWDGTCFESDETMLPSAYWSANVNGYAIYPDTGNRLFVRILEHWPEEFDARYRELRETVFSNRHIKKMFNDFAAQIPREALEADWALHPDIPQTKENTIERITGYYLSKRGVNMDERFASYERRALQ